MSDGALSRAVSDRLERWEADRVADRLWAKDGSLWAESGKEPAALAAWLGWLDLPAAMSARIEELEHLAQDVRRDGYARAAVLGMGGSSLAPDLYSRVFERSGPELRICDSTHPDAVRAFRDWASSSRTLFCVSSKSGSTTEPNAFHAAMASFAPALDFVAITDPGSSLAELARAQEFRAIVDGPPDVGGRYSALSVFGLVPAALHGVDLRALLEGAVRMADACRRRAPENPGLQLGATIGEAARAGRDKLTIFTSPALAPFGDWVEQLIAESTGKQRTGIVPIVGEPVGRASAYGNDRTFVIVTEAADADTQWRALTAELERAGQPVLHLELDGAAAVGGEFVRWEVATAAAGIILGIDPFDQPNVQESKDATKELLDAFRERGSLPAPAPVVADAGIAAYLDPDVLGEAPASVEEAVRLLLGRVAAGDYLALLAYLPADPGIEARLQRVRTGIRDALAVATTLGFGPRFLHSTGQLHKGGPASGVFVQLTAEPARDLPIPGWDESFGTLIAAQALGDLASLQRRRRRVLRLHLDEAEAGLERFEAMVAEALPAMVRS